MAMVRVTSFQVAAAERMRLPALLYWGRGFIELEFTTDEHRWGTMDFFTSVNGFLNLLDGVL